MPKRVLYLYHGFPDRIKELTATRLNGVYVRPGTALVGIDTDSVHAFARRQLVSNFNLREFEVQQKNFPELVMMLPRLGARLLNVEIRNASEEVQDIIAELDEAIIQQDVGTVATLIEELWNEGFDVQAMEFLVDGVQIRFTRLAEVDVASDILDLESVLETVPVGILSGVVRPDGDVF